MPIADHLLAQKLMLEADEDAFYREQTWSLAMTHTLIILGLLCALIALLPPEYDPAILFRDWLNGRR